MTEPITRTIENGVLTLTLSRPDKMNALTDRMYGLLADGIEGAHQDPQARVIVLRGEGDHFTAGNDLGDFAATSSGADKGPAAGTERNVSRFLRALATATRPIVAAVKGRAVGVGTTLLLHCDIVLLAEDARLNTPFINLALVPEAASTLQLPARIGHVRAFEMFALGEAVTAQQALEWGLANRVVPADSLHEQARQIAEAIASKPLSALVATKRLMRDGQGLLTQIEAEGKVFAERLRSPEAAEAFAAFKERRRPDFSRFA